MQSVMESNKTTTYSDHSDLIREARKHESAQGYEKIWLTIRGIEPMVSDLPGWRANHYTTGPDTFHVQIQAFALIIVINHPSTSLIDGI